MKLNYVEPVSDRKLLEGAVKGMLAGLDPHSSYMDAKEYREMRVQTRGEFGGLGMQVTMENGARQSHLADRRHAGRQGRHAGPTTSSSRSTISPVTDMTLAEAVDKLRGAIGTQVKLTVQRAPGRTRSSSSLTRADIKVDPVKSQLQGNDIAYIRITSFTERTTTALRDAYHDAATASPATS